MNIININECLINGVQFKCRTCFEPGNQVYSLTGNCRSSKTYRDILNDIAPIKINGEELLPKAICNKCLEKLICSYDFLLQIQNVNNKYIELLTNHKNNTIDNFTECLSDSKFALPLEQCVIEIKLEDECVVPYDIALGGRNVPQEERNILDNDGEHDSCKENVKLFFGDQQSSSCSAESDNLPEKREKTDESNKHISSNSNMEFVDDSEGEHASYTQTTPVPKKRKKPSVISSWTHDVINCLILSIKEHPCVWEYSCSDYKDRYKREQAWQKIEQNCHGHTIEDCKGKWANLKTAFQNVQKKLKAKSGHGADNTQPHWPYWSAMQFINRYDLSKNTFSVSNVDIQQDTKLKKEVRDEQPSCSKFKNVSSSGKEKHIDIMQRAVKYLETEEDNWHIIGTYLASQMRELAKTNRKAANKLHMQLVKTVMEVLEGEDN